MRKLKITLKWAPITTCWCDYLGREVPDSFSKKYIVLEVGVYGLSEDDCYQFFSDLEDRINKDLADTYGMASFIRCIVSDSEKVNALSDEICWKRCNGQIARQKQVIMESFRKNCKELREQYSKLGTNA